MVDGGSNLIVAGLWAALSGFTVLAFGVDFQMILLALIGSLVSVAASQAPTTTVFARGRAAIAWLTAVILAAVIASAAGEWLGFGSKMTSALSGLLGLAGTPFFRALIDAAGRIIDGFVKRLGGQP
jgi:uncharacterized membrane protein YkvI